MEALDRYYSVLRVQQSKLKRYAVAIARRSHLFPYRTQKLSSLALMILGGRLPGKVGRCRFGKKRSSRKWASFFISARDSWRNLECSLTAIISRFLIKWSLMLVFALSQLFCFVKLSCMPFWLSVRLFYRSYIREDLHQLPLKNDSSRILNPVLSIQDAYDQDQGIFSVS